MASDGKIVIDVILDDGRVVKGVADINRQIDGIDKTAKKASFGVKDMVTALGLVGLAQKGIQLVTSALDGAIKRFDTINGFPSVMERMGFSSEAAQKSINKLSEGIQGLPTTLDGIVGSAQNIAILTGDLDTATDTALSLNNAFLASGASASDAERGLVQYVQMLSKGSVDMQSWRTLQETMGYALNKTAEAFGFAGESAQNDLYAALKDGDISFKEFNAKVIELNGGVNGFADVAKNSSAGIGTSFGNLRNAIVVGVANMIFAFDKLTQEVTGKTIAENLDSLKVIVRAVFAEINNAIGMAAPIVKVFAAAISALIPVVNFLTPAIIGLTAAFAAYTVYTKASAAISAAQTAIAAAEATTKALTIATNARVASQIVMTTTDRAGTVITVASTSAITLKTLAIGVMTGAIKLSTVAQIAAATATKAWGAAMALFAGPIGWVVAGIGLLVTGVIGLVKWFNKSTEEGEKLTQQNEALVESTKALNTSVEESSAAYEKNQKNIETNAQAYTGLVAQIEELAAKEHKTGEEKKLLNSYIQELNKNVDGLNLVYGEQSNALSATSEQILNRINLMKEEEKQTAAQERLTEIRKEQAEIEMQLGEFTALREEWNQKLEEGSVKTKEHKEAMKELEEQELALSEANKLAGEERVKVEQQIIESSKAVADATEEDVGRQLIMYDELSESAQKTVDDMKSAWDDYASAATDMFDKLSDKSKVSVAEMQKNLEENQRIITEWSENIAKLAERGVDEGLLNTLREAGPESAGHVKALVSASDTELNKLSESFAKGGEVATKALSTSLGIENTGLLEAVGHLVIGTEKALSDSIKSANFDGLGVDIAKGQAQGMEKGIPEIKKSGEAMAKAAEDAARDQSETRSPSRVFVRIGTDLADGLALGIKDGIQAVLKSVNSLIQDIVKPFANISSTFEKIGKEATAGMVRGLQAGEKQVLATARSIANNAAQTVRQALDIHSPSRIFEQIGKWISEGWAIGIESTGNRVVDAVSDIALNAKDIAEHFINEEKKLRSGANSEIAKIEKDKATEIAKIQKRMNEDVAKAQRSASSKKKKSAKDEALKIQRIKEDAAAKIAKLEQTSATKIEKIRSDSTKKIVNLESEMNKMLLEETKRLIDDKKSLDQLSLIDEAKIWEQSLKLFTDGSKERVKAQQEHKKAVEAVNKEVLSTNQSYQQAMQKINDDLIKQEQDLNKAYEDAFNKRYDKLFNSTGLFDEFKRNTEITGKELLDNLQGQVFGFREWRRAMDDLAMRGVSDELLKDLSEMGPKALGELQALNQLSAVELEKYSNLYKEKSADARSQTERELKSMREDADKQIKELRETAKKQLTTLQTEWREKIKALTTTTQNEMSSLKQVGVNAAQGLLDGLKSMDGELQKQAKAIANSIKWTIEDALDIHSPSRWMRDFIVGNLARGFDVGVDRQKSFLTNASEKIGDFIKPSIVNPLRGAKVNLGLDKPSSMINNYSTINNISGNAEENSIQVETSDVILYGEKVAEIMYKIVSGKQYRGANMAAMVKGVTSL
ncbi:tape measure protein [Lysinibacillus sp. NPDC047702]|uniref:tape measure protein n=1 Tax=unclassified Lysinibacillus TaxID=2636778 RepID=UPI003CFEED56